MDAGANTDRAIRVLIVEDHDLVAAGLRSLLADVEDVQVVDSVRSVADAIRAAATGEPDVVLMDYRLPDGTGVEAASRIRETPRPPGIVMMTAVADRRVLGQALDAGCCGFVSKNADIEELRGAIRAASIGDSFFTRDILKHLVHLRRFDQLEADLSDREVEVLQLTANGLSPEAIGAELFLSSHTVKNHLRHAMSKLGAHTKLEAVVKAVRARIISIDD